MAFTNSPLVEYTNISPNRSVNRNHRIDRISPHVVVGQCSIEALGNLFADPYVEASSNYGIGYNGKIGMFVEEKDRSWCTSSSSNDNRAVTIECASDTYHPYAVNDVVYTTLTDLCVDICKRNGKSKLLWFGDESTTLNYEPADNEMVITVHRWFANKSCPGDYLYARLGDLASKVTAKLGGSSDPEPAPEKPDQTDFPAVPFTVSVIIDDLNYRSEPSMNGAVKGMTGKGIYTVVEVSGEWGKLKSGAGWIYLANSDYCKIGKTVEVKDASYKVKVNISNLNIRKGPGTNYSTTGSYTGVGIFTIVETKPGVGSDNGWGKLKSGAGWIALDYATKL